MTILMLIPDFGKGGAERVFSQLSAELGRRYRVIDCVFNRDEHREYFSGNETVDLNVQAGSNFLLKGINFVLRVSRLRKIKKKYAVDLTISHLEGADYVNILSHVHDKVVLTVHGTKVHDKNITGVLGWIRLKLLIPFLYRRAAHIISVSQGIKAELVSSFGIPGERISVINNFFDVDRIRALASEELLPAEKSFFRNHDVVVSSGRLVPEKNHRLLIRVMPALLKKRPGLKLVILGSGTELSRLVSEAAGMGLRVQSDGGPLQSGYDIIFPGYRANPFNLLQAARLFVLPSLSEGFPLALCEALICGVPVIAHDCPTGPREIIAPQRDAGARITATSYEECGVLMPFSVQADTNVIGRWAEAILVLLQDQAARHAHIRRGRERALAFSHSRVLPRWIDLIEILRGEGEK